jgi:hypothetical protein
VAGAEGVRSTAEAQLAEVVPDRRIDEIREAAAVVDAADAAVKKEGWSYCTACVLAAAAVGGTVRLRKERNRTWLMVAAPDASLSLQHNASTHLRNNQTCSKMKKEEKDKKKRNLMRLSEKDR